MPQSCHGSRLTLRYWPRLDLGVTCPLQPTHVVLRSRQVMVRSRSGCPTGRPIMRLLNRLRGRLWRFVCAVLASPASGAAAITDCLPALSESLERLGVREGPPLGAAFAFLGRAA